MNRTIRDVLIEADEECCRWCKICDKDPTCFNCRSHKERNDIIQKLNADNFLQATTPEKGVKNDGMGGTDSDSGSMKQRWDLLPLECIEKIVEVYTFGAIKYDDNTWQNVDSERYYAALFRHINDWRKGEIYDEESGLLHLAHAGWNVLALIWQEIQREKNQEKVDFI